MASEISLMYLRRVAEEHQGKHPEIAEANQEALAGRTETQREEGPPMDEEADVELDRPEEGFEAFLESPEREDTVQRPPPFLVDGIVPQAMGEGDNRGV